MVDYVQVALLAAGGMVGIVILGLFVYFSRQLQIALWWKKRLSPMGNWGTIDVWAAKRTYTFIVSFNESAWVLFKTKTSMGSTFVNPSNSKEDADCVIQRWGSPFVSFDIRDGVHPLRLASGKLDRSADPSGLTVLLANMKDLEQDKANNEISKAVKPNQNSQLLVYLGCAAAIGGLVAAYYGYTDHSSIAACLNGAVTAAKSTNSLGGLLSP